MRGALQSELSEEKHDVADNQTTTSSVTGGGNIGATRARAPVAAMAGAVISVLGACVSVSVFVWICLVR